MKPKWKKNVNFDEMNGTISSIVEALNMVKKQQSLQLDELKRLKLKKEKNDLAK